MGCELSGDGGIERLRGEVMLALYDMIKPFELIALDVQSICYNRLSRCGGRVYGGSDKRVGIVCGGLLVACLDPWCALECCSLDMQSALEPSNQLIEHDLLLSDARVIFAQTNELAHKFHDLFLQLLFTFQARQIGDVLLAQFLNNTSE
jgi:hypothetical protein